VAGSGASRTQDGAVLCVAGRSFVDGAACAILVQLLGHRGIGARVVPFSDVAHARIDSFDPGPARVVCIVSTAISGEPTHLRRLAERLKRKLPQAHTVVGLWQADESGGDEAAKRRAIPANVHVSSLRGAVEAVVAAADPNAPASVQADRPAPHPVGTAVPA
jgi:hypothetical protein